MGQSEGIKLSPHAFSVAEAAYRGRKERQQSILVSGDIEVGETECTKMLVRYLSHLGGPVGTTVEQQILKSNPILEAFGNAKAVGNSNSRRFSKSVELQFDNDGRISGASVEAYIYDPTMNCNRLRNYNCFYQLCAIQKYIEEYELKEGFNYLNQTNCYEKDSVSDDNHKEYLATINAMEAVGISSEDQDQIFRVLAAILHLGNVDFYLVEGAHSDGLKIKEGKAKSHLKKLGNNGESAANYKHQL